MICWPLMDALGALPLPRTTFRYLSLCSGIEAATMAWHSLGGRPVAFSEIEAFPCAVLKHRWPDVPNLGDMTKWRDWPEDLLAQVDVLVGGTPCQAFSVAGLRKSLGDERGNLTLIYAHLLDHIDEIRRRRGLPPVICVWENVPGVLNTKDNAFGCFLGALAGEDDALQPAGKKWTNAGLVCGPERTIAWRVLDAQYFGVAQRRRRVFLVASARTGFCPAAVLFESDGLRRDSAPSRQAREGAAYELAPCIAASGRVTERTGDTRGQDCVVPVEQPYKIANCLTQRMHKGINSTLDEGQTPIIAHTLKGEGFDASEDGTGRGTPLVPVAFAENSRAEVRLEGGDGQRCGAISTGGGKPGQGVPTIAFSCKDHGGDADTVSPTLRSMGHHGSHPNGGGQVAVAIQAGAIKENPNIGPNGIGIRSDDYSYTLEARAEVQAVQLHSAVRRLTPRECERLQGFPDDHTLIPWRGKPAAMCPDGPRYKALGNSMAVPCMAWIGKRLITNLP